jgi:hypothetical protein
MTVDAKGLVDVVNRALDPFRLSKRMRDMAAVRTIVLEGMYFHRAVRGTQGEGIGP